MVFLSQQGPPISQDAPYLENDVLGIPLWNIPFLEGEFKILFLNVTFRVKNITNRTRAFDVVCI